MAMATATRNARNGGAASRVEVMLGVRNATTKRAIMTTPTRVVEVIKVTSMSFEPAISPILISGDLENSGYEYFKLVDNIRSIPLREPYQITTARLHLVD
tara:strand:+ start:743 stop:1042 length:300 start_codon:yes stop_codon:yes gene_type:complete